MRMWISVLCVLAMLCPFSAMSQEGGGDAGDTSSGSLEMEGIEPRHDLLTYELMPNEWECPQTVGDLYGKEWHERMIRLREAMNERMYTAAYAPDVLTRNVLEDDRAAKNALFAFAEKRALPVRLLVSYDCYIEGGVMQARANAKLSVLAHGRTVREITFIWFPDGDANSPLRRWYSLYEGK